MVTSQSPSNAPSRPEPRFGRIQTGPVEAPSAGAPADGVVDGGVSIEWLLKRNCSMAPAQLMAVYASLCLISLLIATYFWAHGATLVMPFAWLEMAVVGVCLFVYARHAADRERITLRPGSLTVEHLNGGRIERSEFVPDWVRVEPRDDDRSLIELSAQGRIVAVGRYVRPELRRALAEEFRTMLRRWPGGVACDAV